MPYTAPTPQQIKARFPEFEAVADAAIAFAIEEAMLSVDDSWLESNYAPAIRLLAAHILAARGVLSGDAAKATTVGPLVSESLGDASQTFAEKAKVIGIEGLAAELATTTYGQWFLRLRRVNHPAVALC